MKKILAIVLATCMLFATTALCLSTSAATAGGSVRIVPMKVTDGAYYAAHYFWTGVKAQGETVTYEFYAKGTKGQTITVDLEDQENTQNEYTFQNDGVWEKVSGTLTGKAAAKDQTNGYPLRIFSWQAAATERTAVTNAFWIDNMTIGTHTSDFSTSATQFPIGSWVGANSFWDNLTDCTTGAFKSSIFNSDYVSVYHKVDEDWVAYDLDELAAYYEDTTGEYVKNYDGAIQVNHKNGTSHLYLNNDGRALALQLGHADNSYLEVKFNGTECSILTHYRRAVGSTTSGSIRVTVDGVDVTASVKGELQAASDHNTTETAIVSVTGLEDGAHVIKLENLDKEPGVILRWLYIDSISFGAGTSLYNPVPETADMTSVFALLGVIACAGVVVASKKH